LGRQLSLPGWPPWANSSPHDFRVDNRLPSTLCIAPRRLIGLIVARGTWAGDGLDGIGGGVVAAAAGVGVRGGVSFWIGVLLIALVIALGDATPVGRFVDDWRSLIQYRLAGFSFRASALQLAATGSMPSRAHDPREFAEPPRPPSSGKRDPADFRHSPPWGVAGICRCSCLFAVGTLVVCTCWRAERRPVVLPLVPAIVAELAWLTSLIQPRQPAPPWRRPNHGALTDLDQASRLLPLFRSARSGGRGRARTGGRSPSAPACTLRRVHGGGYRL
jgi:hypothetical protein